MKLVSLAFGSRTVTLDEKKSRFWTRTRSRIFGQTSFIHFFDGSSYAVKSSVSMGHLVKMEGAVTHL